MNRIYKRYPCTFISTFDLGGMAAGDSIVYRLQTSSPFASLSPEKRQGQKIAAFNPGTRFFPDTICLSSSLPGIRRNG